MDVHVFLKSVDAFWKVTHINTAPSQNSFCDNYRVSL